MTDSFIKFPGLVDVHVHLREPGATQKEDFETGTKAAIAGGYTQILDMPNNTPPTVTYEALENKIAQTKNRIWCDLGFNFGATKDSIKYFKKVYKKTFGLKVYMSQTTGPLLVSKHSERDLIFRSWESKLPIMIHAKDGIVDVAISLAEKYKKRIHICHVTPNQLGSIANAKQRGLKITCEVCPHHLFLNKNDVAKLGPLGVMKPPLLAKKDQDSLWDNLDKIDMISTDHAPHTLKEKNDQSGPKFGVPGLETTLPLMLEAISQKKITIKRLEQMLCSNPRKIFNIPSQENTYVIVNTSTRYKISQKKLFTKCKWTPFKNLYGRGEIKEVVIRNKTVFKNGRFFNKPFGKVMHPSA